jgi:hypothetical protein
MHGFLLTIVRMTEQAKPEQVESLGVAVAIRAMTDDEVRSLVDEAYASGLVQTLHDARAAIARALLL